MYKIKCNTRHPFGISQSKSTNRGMALVVTMVVLMSVMAIMLLGSLSSTNQSRGNGLMGLTGNSSQASQTRMDSSVAFNMAESGVEYTLQWLSQQASPPNPNGNWSAFAPALWTSSTSGNPARSVVTMVGPNNTTAGSFSVVVYPSSNNAGNTQKIYLIESVGISGSARQTLRVVAQQKSFGGYAYFNDIELANGYWVAGLNQFDGPMHSNNTTSGSSSLTPTNILWNSSVSTLPMFTWMGTDAYTCSASSINWYKSNLSTHTAPSTNADWLSVALGGAASVHTGTDKIPLPTASTLQQQAALGTANVPASTGVLIPQSGASAAAGVYIHGSVDNMVLSVDSSGNQVVTITQHDSTYSPITNTITINRVTNQTTQVTSKKTISNGTTNTSTITLIGATNGVVYCDSNIGSAGNSSTAGQGLSGTIANNVVDSTPKITAYNSLTIAVSNSSNIYINGNLRYQTARAVDSSSNVIPESQDNNFTLNAGTLGLVANHIQVVDNDSTNHALTNVEVDAATMSYNTFDCTDTSSRSPGKFTLMGSYVAGSAGCFGTIDSNGNLLHGLAEHYHYDARMSDTPPPYFPTTGNIYDVASWQRVSSTLQ